MEMVHIAPAATEERFSCRRGGLTIRGRMFRSGEGVLPAVIICHGFMANQRSVRRYARFLAGLGWAAFTFDFCGGCLRGESDGKQSEMSVLTEIEDLRAVMEYVKQREDVDAGHLSLMGCSQGGVVCALTAAKAPEEVERLILFYPALCIPDDARRGRMLFARFNPEDIPPVVSRFPMRLGAGYVNAVKDMDIFEEIRGYQGPVLLVHGTRDKIVDVTYSRRAREAYGNCEYVEIEGGRHMFRGKHDRMAMEALEKFMTAAEAARRA